MQCSLVIDSILFYNHFSFFYRMFRFSFFIKYRLINHVFIFAAYNLKFLRLEEHRTRYRRNASSEVGS